MSKKPKIPAEYAPETLNPPFRVEKDENPPIDSQIALNSPKNPENPQIPLANAFLIEIRRLREQILPRFYAYRYNSSLPTPSSMDLVEHHLLVINGLLSAAEHAMMDQDVGQMLAVLPQLRSYQ